jgi:stearoyl-CoA desaturase (delta-9 desaturase)
METVSHDVAHATPVQKVSASMLVFLPLVGVVLCAAAFWNHGISWLDLILAVAMYGLTGFGVTVGFHRMLAHASFRPKRALKIALAVAGSMAIEGSALIWVAHHRKHHVYADREEDPHSPWAYGNGFAAQLKGLAHAHVGWLFRVNLPEPERWAQDLESDRDIRLVSRTDTVWFAMSLAIPFGIGFVVTGSLYGAWAAFLWAGVVRVAVLHHVTWGVNSIGHMFGSRPFRTRDQSTNVALLSVLSLGDSWHNGHHAFPMLARHGVDKGQIDASAALIRIFERIGWATDVRWPSLQRLGSRRL